MIIVLFISLLSFNLGFAEKSNPKSLKGFEVLSGFARSRMEKGKYRLYPLLVDLDFDLKDFFRSKGIRYYGLTEFQLEPFINTVVRPNSNIEAGTAFMLKIGILPETLKFQPYIKAGVGMLFMSQHTREMSTRFNFLEQLGAGAHYFLTKKLALTAECRYRHVSNAGIREPNHGMNTWFYLGGITYRF